MGCRRPVWSSGTDSSRRPRLSVRRTTSFPRICTERKSAAQAPPVDMPGTNKKSTLVHCLSRLRKA
jgi:hypothetical protein